MSQPFPAAGRHRSENALLFSDGTKLPIPRNPPLSDIAALVTGVSPMAYCNAMPEEIPALKELARRLKLAHKAPALDEARYNPPAPSRWFFFGRDREELERKIRIWRGPHKAFAVNLGYPRCCVERFRAWKKLEPNDTAWPDLIPSIHAASGPGPWPFLLNNLFNMNSRLRLSSWEKGDPEHARIESFYRRVGVHRQAVSWHSCSYECPKSLRSASKIWAFLAAYMPRRAAELKRTLSGDFLYLSKFEVVALDGTRRSALSLNYDGVRRGLSHASPSSLRALGRGDRVDIRGRRARVLRRGRLITALESGGPLLLSFR